MLWLMLPPLLLVSGAYWHSRNGYRAETIMAAWIGYLVFGILALISCSLLEGRVDPDRKEVPPVFPQDLRGVFIGLVLVSLVAFSSALSLLMKIASAGSFAKYLIERNAMGVGSGFSIIGLSWFGVISVILGALAFTAPQGRRAKYWVTSVFFLIAAVGVGATTGNRTQMLQPILNWCFAYIVIAAPTKVPRSVKVGAPIGLVLLLLAGMALGKIREQAMGASAEVASVSKSLSIEAYQEFENGWWLIENPSFWNLMNGSTFAAGFTFPIPRAVWPDKPVGSGALMTNLVRPRSITDGVASTRSPYTTGLPPEAYMNFGWIGFPFVGLLYGAFMAWMNRLRTNSNVALLHSAWAVLMVRALDLLNAEFFGWVANFLFSLVPFLIVFAVLRLRRASSAV